MEANIVLTRIDNRLVHGQVGVKWVSSLDVNLLVVVDDETATDPLQQQLMEMTAESSGIDIRFFSIEKTISIIHKASPEQKLFIVCKTPEVVMKLHRGGVPINRVNVGNMHYSDGKKPLTKKVYVDDDDLQNFEYLKSKNIDVFIQEVPGEKIKRLES